MAIEFMSRARGGSGGVVINVSSMGGSITIKKAEII